jgi:uncharacterized protein (TIGR03435 family)
MSQGLKTAFAALLATACVSHAQTPAARPGFDAFDVATIKPAEPEPGRFIKMQSAHRFYAKGHTLKSLVCAAYNLNPRTVSGGPAWIESDRYDILAGTPGEIRPNLDEQMAMLRKLLTDRFGLAFHHEQKELSFYALTVARSGPKLKESTGPADSQPELISVVYPDHVMLPARNATVAEFVAMMQRAVLDRPVVDRTGLSGKFDFTLEWTSDESQFGGALPPPPAEPTKPGLFVALQEQLGLKLEAMKGLVEAMVIDRVERPSEN